MTRGTPTGALWLVPACVGLAVVAVIILPVGEGIAAAAAPTVSISPGPSKGGFTDQQVVRVSVGPNSLFTPNSRVVILECSDPGGTVTNLPTSFGDCDENTIQPDTTVVHSDGSFVEPSYSLYALPSSVLGEQANWQPVCNASHPCVLFVGENQNDFTQAKVFSAAFTMSGGGTATGSTTTTRPASVAPRSAAASAAVSVPSSELAFTGTSPWLLWLVVTGVGLMVAAVVVATVVRRTNS